MNVTFNLKGKCAVIDVSDYEDIDVFKNLIEDCLLSELGIEAELVISDFKEE